MDRRLFLKLSAAAGAAACTAETTGAAPAGAGKSEPVGQIAGMSIKDLRERFRHNLFERYVPFFFAHMVDGEKGGFFPYTQLDGAPREPYGRSPWWLGRGIWTTSHLYNHFGRDPRALAAARNAADILLKNRPTGENRWPSAFDLEGKPTAGPSPDIYYDMFAAEGFAEYARASGDDRHRALAKETLFKCLRLYDRPDYTYAVTYGPKADPVPGARILPHWMVLLVTATGMLRDRPDPELEAVARRCTDAIMDGHMNGEYRLLNEVRNRDFSVVEGPFSQFSYTGHAYETLWMVMAEAVRRKDGALLTRAADAFIRHVQVSWDDVYEGAFSALIDVNANTWSTAKSAWSQVEVMTGCLLVLEHRNDAGAREMFGRMYRHFEERYSLEGKGCPLWLLGGDRKLSTVRPGTGDTYHIPRWLMTSILILDRMIERGGRTSGLV